MSKLGMLPVLLREIFGTQKLLREPEPEMLMEDTGQVSAYADSGGSNDGIMAASNLFHSAHISQTIHGCKTVVDLGCGPATQLARIAEINPETNFLGVELSDEMIKSAEALLQDREISNVKIIKGDITDLVDLQDASVDGVISTMSFHHLPTKAHLSRSFSEISRILKPGGAIYFSDFCQLKSIRSIIYFAYKYEDVLPYVLCLDYERSLRAAFSKSEFEQMATILEPHSVSLHVTKYVPVMMVMKTADRQTSSLVRSRVKERVKTLSRKYRSELNDLRLFLRLNGLSDDIFR